MLEIQTLSRSVNELLILSALQAEARHGYQIALQIEERSGGSFSFSHGTLYPILHQLEKEALIDGQWDEGRGRQKRKTYSLTERGRARLGELFAEWGAFHENLSAIVQESAPVRARAASNKR